MTDIKHRVSLVANPHANCRAELEAHTVKKIIKDNVMLTSKLDTKYTRAFMQYRNTRDRDTNRSPAEFLMGGTMHDFLPRSKEHLMKES